MREPVDALKVLLTKLNKKMVVVESGELCCGSVLYTTGQARRAAGNKKEVEKFLTKYKITEMVLLCPGCLRTFHEYYIPRKSNPLKKVYHYTQLLTEDLEALEFKSPPRARERTVTYHDPCHLGRHMGIYDEPRILLKNIPNTKFVELPTSCDSAFCCGSGGGVRALNKELADNTSALRLKEALSIGAEYLVTSCPFCERSFYSAQESDRSLKQIKVVNLAVFIKQNLRS
ncbi:MAG: hypothetical protein JSV49_05345 [Thermoplasmata archaeon]|nr:MAG: hypothetical protein JSV49_05345 [Thermoplasmata archaeon]